MAPLMRQSAATEAVEGLWHCPFTPRGAEAFWGFALDSFGGGFVVQSFAAYWFYLRFGLTPEILGLIFFIANLLSGDFSAPVISSSVALRTRKNNGLCTSALKHSSDPHPPDAN